MKNNYSNIIYGTITKFNDKIKLLKYVRLRQKKKGLYEDNNNKLFLCRYSVISIEASSDA